jgi:hypothetical protein
MRFLAYRGGGAFHIITEDALRSFMDLIPGKHHNYPEMKAKDSIYQHINTKAVCLNFFK